MPAYDYQCQHCGAIREINHSMNEKPNLYHCGHKFMIRKFTPTPTHFKGSGFYETDYKGKP